MNNIFFKIFSRYFPSYIFFDFEREGNISKGLFIQKHYTYHLFTTQKKHTKQEKQHTSLLYLNFYLHVTL
jgi:hypothetical protein